MAYRSWHRDGGRPPPPPYSKHKHNGGGAPRPAGATAANNTIFPGDSRFSTELFKDMSKKIAHLTKVICSLTNRSEDQELISQSARSEHEEQVRNLQSELHKKTEDYDRRIRALEVQLQEEKRRCLKKEEELKTLKQFHALAENSRLFKESLTRVSKDKASACGAPSSEEEIGKLRLEFGLERTSASLCFDSRCLFSPTEPLKNGGSEFTFIGNKLRDMESYEKEVRFLIDTCEKLKAERMSLKTKYKPEDSKETANRERQDVLNDGEMLSGSYADGDKRLSEISLKEQLEKQDFQYRKRISELLQCLTQSESRAAKYRKEIKQLEETLSTKDKQNSLITVELSKALEHLKQSRNENADIRKAYSTQTRELQAKNDLIAKTEDERRDYENKLTSSEVEVEKLFTKLKESQEEVVHLQQLLNAKEADSKELQLLRDKLEIEQKKCEQLEKEFELKMKSIHDSHGEEKRMLELKMEALMQFSLQQEKKFSQQLEDTEKRCGGHLLEERQLHREIQDNLEQQLDLLHRNVQHTIRNEEEAVVTLHMLLEDKEVSLSKTQNQLKEARETASHMTKLIQLKEMELVQVREGQKIHHSTEVRFAVENSPFLPSNDTKQQITVHEFPVIFNVNELSEGKQKFMKGRIEFLEEQNKFLRMEKEEMLKAHLLELELQSESHKEELRKLKQEDLSDAQNNEVFKTFSEESAGKETSEELTEEEKLQGYSGETEVDSYHRKCFELQEAVKKIEEDSLWEKQRLSAEQHHMMKLTSLVEKLDAESSRIAAERESKMSEILRVRNEASQQIKNLENYWQERLVRELKKASHSFENEKQKLVSDFSKAQRLLKDKILLLQSIMKDMNQRKQQRQSEEGNVKAFEELHRTIVEKDNTISKLKEEKRALRVELLNQKDSSANTSSTQALTGSTENAFALKKPRLERPPLTPQLVRRHSLLGSTEQKWLRARSQSPMRGFQPECTSKSSFVSVHRSSWTGEISTELNNNSCLKDDSDVNPRSTAKNIVPSAKNTACSTANLNTQNEQALQAKTEQEKFPVSQNSDESPLANHICDTIAECDELLTTIEEEEKQSTPALKEENLKDWNGSQIRESEV